jgi:hypothetical protein
MESPQSAKRNIPLGYIVTSVVAGALLAWMGIPIVMSFLTRHEGDSQPLNNARQIHIATLRMTTDASVTPDPKLGWPGDLPDIATLPDFVERLVEYKYIDRGDLKGLFTAPGIKPYPGMGRFKSENSAFKMYRVTDNDLSQVIFLATKNFTFGQPLDEKAAPYGKRGAVIFRKGGEGVIINDQQAADSGSGALGFMPGATSWESPGTERDVLQ